MIRKVSAIRNGSHGNVFKGHPEFGWNWLVPLLFSLTPYYHYYCTIIIIIIIITIIMKGVVILYTLFESVVEPDIHQKLLLSHSAPPRWKPMTYGL